MISLQLEDIIFFHLNNVTSLHLKAFHFTNDVMM